MVTMIQKESEETRKYIMEFLEIVAGVQGVANALILASAKLSEDEDTLLRKNLCKINKNLQEDLLALKKILGQLDKALKQTRIGNPWRKYVEIKKQKN